MAFVGLGDVAPVGMGSIGSKIGGAAKSIKGFGKEMGTIGKDLGKAMAPHVSKSAKSMKKAFENKETVKGMGEMFSALGGMASGPINIFMSLLDKLGVVQPILDMLSGLMSVFSGAIMGEMIPAFQMLADFLFSPEMIEKITAFGVRFGEFLSRIITAFIELLDNPEFMEILDMFMNAIMWLFEFIGGTIGAFLNLISTWDPWQVALLFIILGTAIAFLVGVMMGGFTLVGLILGGIFATATAALLTMAFVGSMMSMQTGGYVPATTGGQIIRVGEGGEGEHITTDSQMKEVTWATENNGKKLDQIYRVLANKGRLM